MAHIIADSGERETHESGAVRDIRRGKGRFDLITPVALRRLAKVYEGGAVKYTDRNWEKGMVLSRFLDSAKRHINDYEMIRLYEREGIPLLKLPAEVNPEEDHLAQAVWNLFAMIHFEEIGQEWDDLGIGSELPSEAAITLELSPTEQHVQGGSILGRLFHKH